MEKIKMFKLIVTIFCFSFLGDGFSQAFVSEAKRVMMIAGGAVEVEFDNLGMVSTTAGGSLSPNEGYSTICDALGNLLFYTDGTDVYDNTKSQMSNGGGLFSSNSTTQKVIVQHPGSGDYYIFYSTSHTIFPTPPGELYYSKVDMSGNGGLGVVTNKNTPVIGLGAGFPNTGVVDESVTAVNHANGTDIWVITHGAGVDGNKYFAIQVDGAGVVAPAITSIGANADFSHHNAGEIKASPNGENIVKSSKAYDWGTNPASPPYVELTSFDDATGQITTPITLKVEVGAYAGGRGTYGCSFSPDGSKVYASWVGGNEIWQWDLDQVNIPASGVLISTTPPDPNGLGARFGSLHIGADYNVYIAVGASNYLTKIECPNEPAAVLTVDTTFFDLGGQSTAGFNNLNQSLFLLDSSFVEIQNDTLCPTDTVTTLIASKDGGVWNGVGIIDPVSGEFDPAIAGVGDHVVSYTITTLCETFIDSTLIVVEACYIADTLYICSGDSISINGNFESVAGIYSDTLLLTVIAINPHIQPSICEFEIPIFLSADSTGGLWTGAGILNTASGEFDPGSVGVGFYNINYEVSFLIEGTNYTCVDSTNIEVTGVLDATINLVSDFCDEDANVNLNAVDTGGVWSGQGIVDSISGLFSPVAAAAGTFDITYTIMGSCGATDLIQIVVHPQLDATISSVPDICANGNSITLNGVDSGGVWSGVGISNSTLGILDPSLMPSGINKVYYTITNVCGDIDSLEVTISEEVEVTAFQDATICAGDQVSLSAMAQKGDSNYTYTWNGGAQSGQNWSFVPSQSGEFYVEVLDGCGDVDRDTANITVLPEPSLGVLPNLSTVCIPETVSFTLLGDVTSVKSIRYDFGDGITSTIPVHTYTNDGCYDVSIEFTSIHGCIHNQSFQELVCAYDSPIANFSVLPYKPTNLNPEIQINNKSEYSTNYLWYSEDSLSIENPNDFEPEVTFLNGVNIYTLCLIAVNEVGCQNQICKEIELFEDPTLYVPNAFSPNGDGINDIFFPVVNGLVFPDYTMIVMNRWGEVVYSSDNINGIGWDGSYMGEDSPTGVYPWKIVFNNTVGKFDHSYVGLVTLIK